MSCRRDLGAFGVFALLLMPSLVLAQDEMVANPYYKFWAGSKPGSTAVRLERTKLGGPEGKVLPDGQDEKRIAYRLLEINDERAIVQMVVTERDFLGYIQAAPTRYIYPAKVKKSNLERIYVDDGKPGEDTVKVDGKDIKCKTITGALKGNDGEQVDFKLWLSDEVPGSIVKHTRTTKQKGETIADTTITLQSFKKAE